MHGQVASDSIILMIFNVSYPLGKPRGQTLLQEDEKVSPNHHSCNNEDSIRE